MCYLTTLCFDIVSIVDEWNVSVDRWWSVTDRKLKSSEKNLTHSLFTLNDRERKIYLCIYIYLYVCMSIYLCICICIYTCAYMYVYIYIYIYIYIHSLNNFILEFGILCQQLEIYKTLHSKMYFIILLPDIP